MTPKELVIYIETFQHEVNDISKHSSPAGVTTIKKAQGHYGSVHTGELIRHLFPTRSGTLGGEKSGKRGRRAAIVPRALKLTLSTPLDQLVL
ncbi:MAG TPA: hypothetical protein H9759_08095 [Candidatus Dietzia intestinipullorum]|nr:hypothetical protein [Candidatus Dietzia intestinipullorum]